MCGKTCLQYGILAAVTQVADAREIAAEVDSEAQGGGEVAGLWMDGGAEGVEHGDSEDGMDAETRHLLRTQRHYYDSVHIHKEQVC